MRVKMSIYLLMLMTVICHSVATAEVLDDPTRPPNQRLPGTSLGGTKAAPVWILSQTLISPARRVAIINGKRVQIGERIGGAQVIAIEPARVALRKKNRDILLELLPKDFKRISHEAFRK